MPSTYRIPLLPIGLLFLAFCGCQQQTNNEPSSESTADSLQGDEILGFARKQYATATSYQDKAVLYLTYRLNGRAIQEPHPWSVAWNRSKQFSADWFNAKIRCDGKRMSCYVFDIETGNIDNQQLLIPVGEQVPIQALIDDEIARHFIFGTSELPLDETEAEKTNPLVHPIVGFMNRQLAPTWLTEPQSLTRLEDGELNGGKTYRLQITHDEKEYAIWIDQQTGKFEQVDLPLQYLHSDVLASDEITDLRFFVRFHDAELDAPLPSKRVRVEEKLAAKPVGHFVTLPQPLASERIGDVAREFDLYLQNGDIVKFGTQTDQATVLFWIGGSEALDHIQQLGSLQSSFDTKTVEIGAVYTDEFLQDPGSNSYRLASQYRNLEESGVDLYYDRAMQASTQLMLKSVPALVVFDQTGKLQYAKAIDSDDWAEHLAVAVKRVLKGEQVSEEMLAEYQKFLDEYHQQVRNANSNVRVNGFAAPQKIETAARLVWESSAFQNPGNIHVPINSNRIFVIDGWQTVVEMNGQNGAIIKRNELELPNGSAINRIRSYNNSENQLEFVAFSLLGKNAFVFDEQWHLLYQFPSPQDNFEHRGITECQLGDFDNNRETELWCSFVDQNGLQKIDIESGKINKIVDIPTKSFYKTEKSLFHIVDDQLALDSAVNQDIPVGTKITAVKPHPVNPNRCLAVGKGSVDKWKIYCVSDNSSIIWTAAIGSQYFNTEIDPISSGKSFGKAVFAIVSDDQQAIILSDEGNQRFEYLFKNLLKGIAVLITPDSPRLIISEDQCVRLWNWQNSARPSFRPISNSRRR